MIKINNDYMRNKRGYDFAIELKKHNNASNIVEIFFDVLTDRINDYIIRNSAIIGNVDDIMKLVNTERKVSDFKRALADQALYLMNNSDLSMIIPEQGKSLSEWREMRICDATKDILNNLGLTRKAVSHTEINYASYDRRRLY